MNTAKIFFLAFLIFGNVSFGYAQEPNPPTPESKITPQASPTSSQVPPEISAKLKELEDELKKGQSLFYEGNKLSTVKPIDLAKVQEKLNEALSVFHSLDQKISDEKSKTTVFQSNEEAFDQLQKLEILTKSMIAFTFSAIANTYRPSGEWKENVEYLKRTIEALKEITENKSYRENKSIPGNFILTIQENIASDYGLIAGVLSRGLGSTEESIQYRIKAIETYQTLFQTTQDKKYKLFEAFTLTGLGNTLNDLPERRTEAIKFLNDAIAIYQTFPDKQQKVAQTLEIISIIFLDQFDYVTARNYIERSLEIQRQLNDKNGQASSLQHLAQTYWMVDDKANADKFFKQAVEILESPDFPENRKKILQAELKELTESKEVVWEEKYEFLIKHFNFSDLGFAYFFLENYPKSLESFEKALELSQGSKELGDIASDLSNIGMTLGKQNKWLEAAKYYEQAYEIKTKTSSKLEIAEAAQDVGQTLVEAGKFNEALKYENDSLIAYQSIGVEENKGFSVAYSSLLIHISQTYNGLGNKPLAILYGKRAVNAIQAERQRLQNLDPISQKGFLAKKEKHYRRLADWLIEAGRLVEAEKVLAMLKEEEVSDYLRGNPAAAEKLSLRLEYTAEEQKAIKEYDKNSETIAAIGAEFGKLEDLKRSGVKLTDEQEKRFGELNEKLRIANQEFQNFLNEFGKEFTNNKNPENDLRENFNLKSDLKSFGEGVVFVYTLVGEEKFSSILVTPKTQFSNQKPMKAAELNKKIFAFREAVKNPNLDPRPLGKELYDVLIKPIEKDLDAARAKTILWHLDGNLRLLPMAALWDGKQYFGQKYQNVVITGKSLTRIGRVDSSVPNVLGLGVSDAKTIPETSIERKFTFNALPSVPFELGSIVKTQKSPKGVLTGASLLNAEFNRKSFAEQLLKGFKIIHIASHFSINAGDASHSFLLLGDGTTLTVSELNTDPSFESKFSDVELLTLSACDTAVGETDSNGKEVEGFAYVAQQNGAKAILATLWSVADESTAFFMSEFYRIKKANPQLSKSEAIQMAQKEMLEGTLKSATDKEKPRAEIVGTTETKANAPRFQTDKSKPFAHPYYWSPFVLIGNWK